MVVPDCEAAPAVSERLRQRACRMVPHASGRPWLVGCWSEAEVQVVAAGAVRLAVFGVCGRAIQVTGAPGEDATRGVEDAVRGAPGSFHVLASIAGRVYARGTASGDRRLFHADVDGITLAADRARTLAWLTGARVDMRQVAVRMTSVVAPPHPLDQASMFHDVHALAPGDALELKESGRPAVRRWWRPPVAEVPLPEGAEGLREALRGAVAARVREGGVWAADLSGGMDSTSLCFLAAQSGAELVALTCVLDDPRNEDGEYARQATAWLPAGTVHLTFAAADLPRYFTGLAEGRDPGDEPSLLMRDAAQQHRLMDAIRAHGAVGRLNGQGGDQMVLPPVGHLHDLARHRPALAWRHLNGYAVKRRWSRLALPRTLADRRGYGAWLEAQARALPRQHNRFGIDAALGWGPPVVMPSWATGRARDLVTELLREAAAHATPLAPGRGRHQWLYQARQAGRTSVTYAQYGMPLEMPFCDDAVLEACLRVRPHEANTPWAYKPLLAGAMRGIVPAPLLERTTKDGASSEWHAGVRAHQRELDAWSRDSHLVAAGLAERHLLRRCWLNPGMRPLHDGPAIEATLAVEGWLRDLARHPVPGYLKEHRRDPSALR